MLLLAGKEYCGAPFPLVRERHDYHGLQGCLPSGTYRETKQATRGSGNLAEDGICEYERVTHL
jgi:hypothetical protein